jgi:hypothetical protein
LLGGWSDVTEREAHGNQLVGVRSGEILGFHDRMRPSVKRRGRYYLNKWPSDRAMASIKGKVRERTDKRHVGLTLEAVAADLNPVLRGWGTYFAQTDRTTSANPPLDQGSGGVGRELASCEAQAGAGG